MEMDKDMKVTSISISSFCTACFLVAVLSMAGCSSTPYTVVKDGSYGDDCTFPDATNIEAPAWVCTEQLDNVEMVAVGYAEKTAGGIAFARQIAVASARVTLAQRMKVVVSNMVKDYAESTGVADSELVDRVRSSVSRQVTSETLVGTKMYKSVISPKGTMYVLVGLDNDKTVYQKKKAVKSSYDQEAELWQQFRSSLAQDELIDAIVDARRNN